jgi:hypothetical protein
MKPAFPTARAQFEEICSRYPRTPLSVSYVPATAVDVVHLLREASKAGLSEVELRAIADAEGIEIHASTVLEALTDGPLEYVGRLSAALYRRAQSLAPVPAPGPEQSDDIPF